MIYTPEFTVEPDNSPYPRPAQTFQNWKDLISAYEDFCADCDRWGQTPAGVFVYYGEPTGNEAKYGYPDYPERYMERAEGGRIRVVRT